MHGKGAELNVGLEGPSLVSSELSLEMSEPFWMVEVLCEMHGRHFLSVAWGTRSRVTKITHIKILVAMLTSLNNKAYQGIESGPGHQLYSFQVGKRQ